MAVPHPQVARGLAFIKAHFNEPITLDDISQNCGMSRNGLERAFVKHLGVTPSAELRLMRIAQAKKMLTETEDKLGRIAFDCGYSNSSNLGVAFKRAVGMTPRAYRLKYAINRGG